jgi:hypothetical protein
MWKIISGVSTWGKKLGNAAVEETKWLFILNYTKLHNYNQFESVEFLNIMAGGTCFYHRALNCCIIFLLHTGLVKEVPSRV